MTFSTPEEQVKWAAKAASQRRCRDGFNPNAESNENSQQLSTRLNNPWVSQNPTATLHKASQGFTGMRFLGTKLQSSPPSGRGSSCAYRCIPGQKGPRMISDDLRCFILKPLKPLKPTIQISPSCLRCVHFISCSKECQTIWDGKKNCSSHLLQNAVSKQSTFDVEYRPGPSCASQSQYPEHHSNQPTPKPQILSDSVQIVQIRGGVLRTLATKGLQRFCQ